MNKKTGGQQPWLNNRWFKKDRVRIIQPMFFKKKMVFGAKKKLNECRKKESFGYKEDQN